MYYRVSIQMEPSAPWRWRSTPLSSLDTLFQFLRLYRTLPPDRLHELSSSTREELHEQLVRQNLGLASPSVTAAQFLQERRLCPPEPAPGTLVPGTQEHKEGSSIAVSTMVRQKVSSIAAHMLDERSLS